MKPFSILLTIILGLISLSLVVWIAGPKKPVVVEKPPVPTVEDLPMPKSGPYGKAEVAESEFNFGVKNVNDEDQHTFAIKNAGEGILEFKMGKPTCQCTVGEITNQNGEVITEGPIAPGESINILVKWKMKVQMEKFRQSVPVFTTDPERRKIEFAIVGEVDNPFHILPPGSWDLGEISATEPSIAKGHFVSKLVDSFTISEVPRENSRAKVTLTPVDISEMEAHQVKSGYTIKVEVGPDVPVGIYRESIKFKTESSHGETIAEITVTGRRSGPIDIRGVVGAGFNVNSNRLVFSDFPASQGKKAQLTLFVKNFDDDLVLKSVEPANSPIKVTLQPGKLLGKSKSYLVEVEIPPGPVSKHRANDADGVTLNFNHPDVPEFKLLIDYNATR